MKFNYGLSGLGGISKTHLLGLKNLFLLDLPQQLEVDFKVLATTHKPDKETIAKKLGFENVVASFDELLEVEELDLIDLCTPNFIHHPEIIKSLAADKNIYAEKPLSLDLKEAESIMAALDKSNSKNQLAFVYRFLPAVAKAHALLQNNAIGEIKFAKVEYYHSRYLNPEVGISWRLQNKKSGGGALVDLGSHVIDLVHFLLGEVKYLNAWTKTFLKTRKNSDGKSTKVDVDDWALLMLQLENEINVSAEVSRVSPGNEELRLHIFGDKGAIYIDFNQPEMPTLYDNSPAMVRINPELMLGDDFTDRTLTIHKAINVSQGLMIDLHTVSLVWFLLTLAESRSFAGTPDFKAGYQVQKVLDAAYKSASAGSKKVIL